MPFPFRVSYFSWIPFWQNLKCLIPQTRPKLLRPFEAGPDFEKKEKILKKAFRNLAGDISGAVFSWFFCKPRSADRKLQEIQQLTPALPKSGWQFLANKPKPW
jgi:hypothetical protein